MNVCFQAAIPLTISCSISIPISPKTTGNARGAATIPLNVPGLPSGRVLLADGSAVDVAAHRADHQEVILLAYRCTPAKFVEGTALSVQSILDGYPEETSGTLFIVQNNQVIASNRPELIGQDTTASPPVQEIRSTGLAEKLTPTHGWNGSGCYFGMYSHGRSFDLYAYTPGNTAHSWLPFTA